VAIGRGVSVGIARVAETGNGVGLEAQAVIQIQINIKTRFMSIKYIHKYEVSLSFMLNLRA
jgi:hypothetical protein